MRLLRLVSTLVLVLALGWSGWWYLLALGQEAALVGWFEARRAAGWHAEYDSVRLRGFPFAVVREIEGLALADPAAGWSWSAPSLVIESAPLDPRRFALVFPSRQRLAVPGRRFEITAEAMRATVAALPDPGVPIRSAELEVLRFTLDGGEGWRARGGALRGAVALTKPDSGPVPRHAEAEAGTTPLRPGAAGPYEIRIGLERAAPPEALRSWLDPLGVAGPEIERVRLDARAYFDRPLGLRVIEEGRLGVLLVDLAALAGEWGELRLAAKGHLAAGWDGRAEGEVTLSARHWREIVAMAERAGLIGRDFAATITAGLEFLAGLDGHPESLDGTLRLAGGRVWFGPVPLASAPRIAPAAANAGR